MMPWIENGLARSGGRLAVNNSVCNKLASSPAEMSPLGKRQSRLPNNFDGVLMFLS